MEAWEKLIYASTDASWKAEKFSKRLKEHKARYDGFIVERAATFFSEQNHKYQAKLAYTDISELNKSLRKIGYRTDAELAAEEDYNDRYREYQCIPVYTYDKDKDPYGG